MGTLRPPRCDAPPPPVPDLGEGDPPAAMAEHYGMRAVPGEGPSDEEGGELIDPDDAVAVSEAAANAGPGGHLPGSGA